MRTDFVSDIDELGRLNHTSANAVSERQVQSNSDGDIRSHQYHDLIFPSHFRNCTLCLWSFQPRARFSDSRYQEHRQFAVVLKNAEHFLFDQLYYRKNPAVNTGEA
jgi:hypothetical protein